MNKMTIDEKITKINNDRVLLLDMIKKNIVNKSTNVDNNIAMALDVLKYDEENVKKYKAVLNAQSLIINLTKQIINATTVEEIDGIRKKLNYYINMIKKEFAKRGINDNELEVLKNNTNYLRKGISSYIRFIKREKNINEIMLYNSSLNTLTDEDNKKFKKMLTNELRYNKRNLTGENNKKNNSKTNTTKLDVNPIDKDNDFNNKNDSQAEIKEDNQVLNNNKEEESLESKFINSIINSDTRETLASKLRINNNSKKQNVKFNYSDAVDRIKTMQNKYGIIPPIEYKNSSMQNIFIFIRNIPRYIRNKKAIKYMKNDSKMYYAGEDLFGYINYLKKSNSILRSFRQLFSKSYLFSKENEYLNNHNRCVEWITYYFKDNTFANVKTKTI